MFYNFQRIGSRHQTMVPVNPSTETGKAPSSVQSAGRPVKADKRSRDGTPVNAPCFASSEGLGFLLFGFVLLF
jgi:hypothetical protein